MPMKPLPLKALAQRIEKLAALDAVSGPVAGAVDALVPPGEPLKEVLSGTWLGEPVHPPLTDVVVGAWTSAVLLDVFGGRQARPAADRLVGLGCLAALPTAVTGLNDFADTTGGPQRVAVVHAAGNVTALTLFGMSWLARRRGRRLFGLALSMMGMGAATLSAYLGGHLSFGRGVGVDQTAFETPAEGWTGVIAADAVPEGRPVAARAGDIDLMLYAQGGRILALSDRCSHRGCALHEGSVTDGAVECPCHGSIFRLDDGSIVRGPATAPQPTYETRVTGGMVEVRPRS
jgi:nitrite reductase/ring-hydroxylating ferredoxin subunit/uncharacterized membrane protein